ncbi:hypothetical protein J1605_005900 [Eschrichtius robustus]|uniref:Uncharacterized protein n=1 Tax=Eschrichtius robustus TaxID=9764 RepID=A0AB34H889_ESCRO|nr:hypothetical protein J1605_005900 [Eschrichtius robustus]
MPSSESLEDDDKLSPEDEAELEEEAARYHNPDFDDGIFAALKNAPSSCELAYEQLQNSESDSTTSH